MNVFVTWDSKVTDSNPDPAVSMLTNVHPGQITVTPTLNVQTHMAVSSALAKTVTRETLVCLALDVLMLTNAVWSPTSASEMPPVLTKTLYSHVTVTKASSEMESTLAPTLTNAILVFMNAIQRQRARILSEVMNALASRTGMETEKCAHLISALNVTLWPRAIPPIAAAREDISATDTTAISEIYLHVAAEILTSALQEVTFVRRILHVTILPADIAVFAWTDLWIMSRGPD